MARFWTKYAPYWHICTAILFALYVAITQANDVLATIPEMAHLKDTQARQEKKITRIDYNIWLIGQKFGIPTLPPGKDE